MVKISIAVKNIMCCFDMLSQRTKMISQFLNYICVCFSSKNSGASNNDIVAILSKNLAESEQLAASAFDK